MFNCEEMNVTERNFLINFKRHNMCITHIVGILQTLFPNAICYHKTLLSQKPKYEGKW